MGIKSQRLFFALWPEQNVRQQLLRNYHAIADLRGQGKPVSDCNLHITLHFLGNIPTDRIECFLRQAELVKGRPFDLKIDSCGWFKKPKVFWFGTDRVPSELSRVHQQLGELISDCDYLTDQRTYRPHVTMARKISRRPAFADISPVLWPVDRFVLVKSDTLADGVKYEVLNSFPLD
jgi:2'-5' RNA ligase